MEWSLKTIIKSIEENEKDEKEIESGKSFKLKVWEGLKIPWSTNLKLKIDQDKHLLRTFKDNSFNLLLSTHRKNMNGNEKMDEKMIWWIKKGMKTKWL
jgi:hypothetical protein